MDQKIRQIIIHDFPLSTMTMASTVFFKAPLSTFLLLLLFGFVASADEFITNHVPSDAICDITPNPSYCGAVLPRKLAEVHDFCRFSIQKSLFQTRKLSSFAKSYLLNHSTSSQGTIRAIQDCIFLSQLSVEYLSKSREIVMKPPETLSSSQADDAHSWLSAILTNHHTCLSGLTSTASNLSAMNGPFGQLSDDANLHSLSLALFTKGWVHAKDSKQIWNSKGWHPGFRNGRLPLKMSKRTRAIYDSVRGRGKKQDDENDDEDSVLIRDIVVVSQDGSGNFSTINDAVTAAPTKSKASDGYFLIYITEGVYEEYVSITFKKRFLMMIGDGINRTIITGNHSDADGWTTYDSQTFAVVAPGSVAARITFRNTARPSKHQAVAMRSESDQSTFYRCSFEGYQDTLYPHSLRQFYRESDIYGTVDFIFGNAAVVLQNCNIYARLPLQGQFNAITAQGRTDPNQNTGISIHNCTIKPADDLAASGRGVKTYLGRPWKQYSRTIVMQSFLDRMIDPAGWFIWRGDFALETLYYAEFDNSGPGANTSNRVTWQGYHVINATDAANFTVSNFVDGDYWLPRTGVPYVGGLFTTS